MVETNRIVSSGQVFGPFVNDGTIVAYIPMVALEPPFGTVSVSDDCHIIFSAFAS